MIEGKNLSEIRRKLQDIPIGERRVVILVGRHESEETHRLAINHEETWRRIGGTPIAIPPKLTPEGFWHEFGKHIDPQSWSRMTDVEKVACFSRALAKTAKKTKISGGSSDNRIIQFLIKSGFDVPVVNFHGTPHTPGPQDDRRHGLGAIPLRSTSRLTLPTHIPELSRINTPLETHPNEMVIEYYFPAVRAAKKEEHPGSILAEVEARRLWRKMKPGLRRTWRELARQLHPDYLEKERPSRFAQETFDMFYSNAFNDLIAHLAQTGLKERTTRKKP